MLLHNTDMRVFSGAAPPALHLLSSPLVHPSVASSRRLDSAVALIFDEDRYGHESLSCSLYRALCPNLSIGLSIFLSRFTPLRRPFHFSLPIYPAASPLPIPSPDLPRCIASLNPS
ncbi:hypothetical protein ACLOJK_009415 [Asimina triloba]